MSDIQTRADEGTFAGDLDAAKRLIKSGQYDSALTRLSPLLERQTDNIDALYMTAVCERYCRKMAAAKATLHRLILLAPEFGRAIQEEGHLYRALNEPEKARLAYLRACRANPALDVSWRELAKIYRAQRNDREAAQAAAQAARLQSLPRELHAAMNHLHEGRLQMAEELCRAFLQQTPHHIEGMRLLAEIASRVGALPEADFLLESAIEFDPDNIQLRLDYIQLLRRRQKFEQAFDQSQSLYNRDNNNPMFQSQYAIEAMQIGDHELAFDLFGKVLEKLPGDPATLTSQGHGFKTFGRHDDAVRSYRAAFAAKPDYGNAYHSLANLKTYRFTERERALMHRQLESTELGFSDRISLNFAIGKAYEDEKNFERSFLYYEQGNTLKLRQTKYKPSDMTAELTAQKEACSTELFESRMGSGNPAPDPVFIVGLPRAGSTLLEQIIASHSKVDGTLELPNILALSYRLRGRNRSDPHGQYPGKLNDTPAQKFRDFGEQFIEDTRVHRQDAPYFIDKMPNNFRHIGLIHLILPNAKIIDARRHPMDCCFSGFKQLFAEGQEFTYGLEVIGQYYRDYVSLMDHWDEVLPGKVLRVQYEDVVADTEAQVRRMLDYLGLPFEEACLEFHKTKRSVRTASSEQVRQPINTKGIAQWRHYEPWLEPLKKALGPVLDRYPI